MGQCIYVANRTFRREGPLVRELESETWSDPAEAGRVLGKDHFLNTTIGVWLYESDLHDKTKLRATLLALVDHVTGPNFMPEYEALGRSLRSPDRKREQARLRATRKKSRTAPPR